MAHGHGLPGQGTFKGRYNGREIKNKNAVVLNKITALLLGAQDNRTEPLIEFSASYRS